MTSHQAVTRARSMLGQKTAYVLGAGGRKPDALTPVTTITKKDGSTATGCDCMGFVAWAWGFDRFQRDYPIYGGWINTDSMLGYWRDGKRELVAGFFETVKEILPGDLLVYPSVDLDRDGKRDRVGHVAMVTDASLYDGSYGSLTVIHCASSHYKKQGDAIQETTGALWDRAKTFRGKTDPRFAATVVRPVLQSRI